jgi:Zn finger protein HypA/HybF involved in hydrogenase expression
MHEVALVAELVDVAVARSAGRPVALVRVRRATTIPDDVLRQSFEMLVVGTTLGDAVLEVTPFDVRLACACGFDGALEHDDVIGPSQAVCPGCGELRGIPPTAELELVEVAFGDGT